MENRFSFLAKGLKFQKTEPLLMLAYEGGIDKLMAKLWWAKNRNRGYADSRCEVFAQIFANSAGYSLF